MLRGRWKIGVGVLGVAASAVGLLRCVGDTPGVSGPLPDSSTPTNDQISPPNDAPGADTAIPDSAPPPPTPDGSLAWVENYNTNFATHGLAIRDGVNPSYIGVGAYENGTGSDLNTYIGSKLLPSAGTQQKYWAPTVYALDPNGNTLWARGIPNSSDSAYFDSVATDVAGDIYIAGFMGPNTVNEILATAHSGAHLLVTKLKGDNSAFAWDHTFTTADANKYTLGNARVATRNGKVFVMMTFATSVTDDNTKSTTVSTASPGYGNVAVVAIDASNGNTLWTNRIGSTGMATVYGNGIATDEAGDVYVVGGGSGTIDAQLGGTGFPIMTIGAADNAFIAKLSATDGKSQWTRALGDPTNAYTYTRGISVRSGIVGVAGVFGGTVNFGANTTLATAGQTDGYVLALDAAKGGTLFATSMGGSLYDEIDSVGVDLWGNVIAVGTYSSTNAKIGSKSIPPSPVTLSIVSMKLNSTGTLLWSHTVLAALNDGGTLTGKNGFDLSISSLGVSNTGDVFFVGGMAGGGDFGSGTVTGRKSNIYDQYCKIVCSTYPAPDGIVVHFLP